MTTQINCHPQNDSQRLVLVYYRHIIEKAEQLGYPMVSHTLSFDLTGTNAGQHCIKVGCNHIIRLNMQIVDNHSYSNTVIHEVAHLIHSLIDRKAWNRSPHCPAWQEIDIALGGNGRRTHSMPLQSALPTYEYTTTTGHLVTLTSIRHNRVQQGNSYRFKGKGTVHPDSKYRRVS